MKKLTTEQFVERIQEIHGDTYDYSKTKYLGSATKVSIHCPTHGEFEQRPSDHLRGSGCPSCAGNKKLNKNEFIKQANTIHDNQYDYSRVQYKNVHTKVKIICKDHGSFKQTPTDHIHGKYGCPACGGTQKVTIDNFINRANKIHDNKYNYTQVVMNGMNTNVVIKCQLHGEFSQRPADHVNGAGCLECSLGKRGQYSKQYFETYPEQKNVPGILYLAKVGDQWCKIGITKQASAYHRFRSSDVSIVHEYKMPLEEAYTLEQDILKKFAGHQYKANALRTKHFAGWTECFPISLLNQLVGELRND